MAGPFHKQPTPPHALRARRLKPVKRALGIIFPGSCVLDVAAGGKCQSPPMTQLSAASCLKLGKAEGAAPLNNRLARAAKLARGLGVRNLADNRFFPFGPRTEPG
jgi:hypothetical protein